MAMMSHEDEGVALESCEFWMAFCEAEFEKQLLRPHLDKLVPMLLKNMVRPRLNFFPGLSGCFLQTWLHT